MTNKTITFTQSHNETSVIDEKIDFTHFTSGGVGIDIVNGDTGCGFALSDAEAMKLRDFLLQRYGIEG